MSSRSRCHCVEMNTSYLLFYSVILIIFECVESVKVSIYYESLCSDSTNFIGRQLYPNYSKLKEYMELELIPYGKAIHNYYDGKWHFECQHGTEECKGNKYQSCALAQKNGQEKDLSFVYCVMREKNPSDVTKMENCAKRVNIDWNKITQCAQSDEGDSLLARNGDKTNNVEPNISFVPTVVFDGQFDEYLQEVALNDFAAVVCSKIQGQKPQVCDNKKIPEKRVFWDYLS